MISERTATVVHSPRVERRRPGFGRHLARLSLALLLGTPVLFLFYLSASESGSGTTLFGAILAWGALGAPVIALASALLSSVSWPRPRPARLCVTGGALVVEQDGQRTSIEASSIDHGFVIPAQPTARLVLHVHHGDVISFEMPNETSAEYLLAQLGVGAERKRIAVQLGTSSSSLVAAFLGMPLLGFFWTVLFSMLLPPGPRKWPIFVASWIVATCGSTYLLALYKRPTEVIVGRDGVVVRRRFRKRMVPFASIVAVRLEDGVLRIHVSSPSTETIVLEGGAPGVLAGLKRRIVEAMALADEGHAEQSVAELLDQAGRPLAAWREALRAAELPEARTRIRIAAETCVDEALRRALEEAAEDELAEETLSRALR